MLNSEIDAAKIFFANGLYEKSKEIFLNNGMLYEAGLCSLLMRNLNSARLIWEASKDPCTGTVWGLAVLNIIEKKHFGKNPTYFQIRAFLEVYIALFIENELFDYADALINSCRSFISANSETPKFLARVLSSFGYNEMAYEFLEITFSINSCDPEAFYILAETKISESKFQEASEILKQALKITPEYYPAIKLKEQLENAKNS